MNYATWRRRVAVSESLALRHLYRTHGHMPACQPTSVDYGEYEQTRNADRSRAYRAKKKREAA